MKVVLFSDSCIFIRSNDNNEAPAEADTKSQG
jgi:hypothetical protein